METRKYYGTTGKIIRKYKLQAVKTIKLNTSAKKSKMDLPCKTYKTNQKPLGSSAICQSVGCLTYLKFYTLVKQE